MYKYEGCGLPNVYLESGYELVKTAYGKGIRIHDLEGLHRVIGEAVVESTTDLTGAEFRFLRQELELSQSGLASIIGKTEQSIARWEKGASQVDPVAQRLIRVLYRDAVLGDKKLKPVLRMLQDLECKPQKAKERIVLREGKGKRPWLLQASTR